MGRPGHRVLGTSQSISNILLWDLVACGKFFNLSPDGQGTPCRSPSFASFLEVDILQQQLWHLAFLSVMINSMAHWEGGEVNLEHAFLSCFIFWGWASLCEYEAALTLSILMISLGGKNESVSW